MSTYKITVNPECLDGDGLARVPALYAMLINTIGYHIKEEGFGIDDMAGRGLSWALVRCGAEFIRRPALYESLSVIIEDGEQNGLSFSRYVTIRDSKGSDIATGVADWCVIEKESHRPAVLEVPFDNSEAKRPCRIPRRLRPFTSGTWRKLKVGYSECDFNGHLNNCRYIEMFYDLLPFHIVSAPGGIRLDVNFKREVPLGGETVSYLKENTESSSYDYCLHYNGTPACCASVALF